jgi:KUP system potassium uptake protein
VTPRRSAAPLGLVVAATGVVFGDIGTSPLYTLKVCFTLARVQPTLGAVLGVCSLLLWALILVVCVKYVTFILRVDHDGEGGILALLALASPPPALGSLVRLAGVTAIVILGASMLFGDGIITPAISVISAVEGISVASSAAQPFVVPISLAIIIGLFALQRAGTGRVGALFGPVMVVWFVVIALLGARALLAHPDVLWALDPRHAVRFMTSHGIAGFTILGGVILAVTGVEALYADLSHFGRGPIVTGWYALVFPSLVLNYLGQGAVVLGDPRALANPFYALAPAWALVPMVVLATAATVIASQALISGTFTLIEQAIALNLAPRMLVRHTSDRYKGQVFVPAVNLALAIGCAVLVVTFKSSDRLASAYGLAVGVTMLCTSLAYFTVIAKVLHWNRALSTLLVLGFLVVDGSLVAASLPKFLDGGYIPVTISVVLVLLSTTWLEGRRCLSAALAEQQTPIAEVLERLPPGMAEHGTMIFLTPDPRGVPFLARHRWIRERAKDERVVVLNVARAGTPYVAEHERVTVERFSLRLIRVIGRFGYMETPRIRAIIRACAAFGLDLESEDTSFFYADPKIAALERGGMPKWRRELFVALQRNARPLPDDLAIPAERRVELGLTVAI